MKFGIHERKQLTGAGLAVRITQAAAALPVLYLLIASGWYAAIVEKNAVSFLFDLGVSTIPRAVALAMSWLYRLTGSEVLFGLLLVALALIYGLVMQKLLCLEHGRSVRVVLAALIALDLIARLLPLRFSAAFGLPVTVLAFAVRAGCLVLVLLDLKASKTERNL